MTRHAKGGDKHKGTSARFSSPVMAGLIVGGLGRILAGETGPPWQKIGTNSTPSTVAQSYRPAHGPMAVRPPGPAPVLKNSGKTPNEKRQRGHL